MNKTLVLYSLRNQEEENRFLDNLKFFINNGGVIDSPEIDYILIVNSKEKPNIDLPKKVKLLLKPNFGHGWGGWKEGLDTVNINDYNYFCLIKDLVIGPFLNNNMNKNWINYLKNLIDDETKLIGYTMSITKSKNRLGGRIALHEMMDNEAFEIDSVNTPCEFISHIK